MEHADLHNDFLATLTCLIAYQLDCRIFLVLALIDQITACVSLRRRFLHRLGVFFNDFLKLYHSGLLHPAFKTFRERFVLEYLVQVSEQEYKCF